MMKLYHSNKQVGKKRTAEISIETIQNICIPMLRQQIFNLGKYWKKKKTRASAKSISITDRISKIRSRLHSVDTKDTANWYCPFCLPFKYSPENTKRPLCKTCLTQHFVNFKCCVSIMSMPFERFYWASSV